MAACESVKRSTHLALGDLNTCHNLPQDQWKVEARKLFEISLAQIQFNVLNIMRGMSPKGSYQDPGEYKEVPPKLRGLCKMGKVQSVGWRNVSVWALFGLFSFAVGVALASVKTEEEEFWLIVGVQLLMRALRWSVSKI